jgi:uncharacterized alkaline shock family protein YloU
MSDLGESKAEAKTELGADAKAEAKTEAKAEFKAETRTETRTEARTGASPEAKAESKTEHPRDKIHIADEVISAIAVLAIGKIREVAASSAGVSEGLAGLLGMKSANRGVKIETAENGVSADIYVTAEYGHKINVLAKELQCSVRDDIEEMTGLKVLHVNVHVLGIFFKDVKEREKEPKDAKAPRGLADDRQKEQKQLREPKGANLSAATAAAANAANCASGAGAADAAGSAGAANPAGAAASSSPGQASETG